MIIASLSLHKLQQASLLITLPKNLLDASLSAKNTVFGRADIGSVFLCPLPTGSDPRWASKPHTQLQFLNAHLQPCLFVRGEKVAEGEGVVEKDRGRVKACIQFQRTGIRGGEEKKR